MTQREVYQLFSEWFDSVGFVGMTDTERTGFGLGFLLDIVTIIINQ